MAHPNPDLHYPLLPLNLLENHSLVQNDQTLLLIERTAAQETSPSELLEWLSQRYE